MSDIDKVRQIAALFLQTDPAVVGNKTAIDKTAIKSSVLIHRMYSQLQKEGFVVADYGSIHTFGNLLASLRLGEGNDIMEEPPAIAKPGARVSATNANNGFSIGIDIEAINNMPETPDYWEDPFYRRNFSEGEIGYCVLQPDPPASFAGRFAAKEAVVKADNGYQSIPFNEIEISSTEEKAPIFDGFAISISHLETDDKGLAIAVAVKSISTPPKPEPQEVNEDRIKQIVENYMPKLSPTKKDSMPLKISVLGFLSSIGTLMFVIYLLYRHNIF